MEMIVSRYQDMVLNITVDDSRNNKFLAVNVQIFQIMRPKQEAYTLVELKIL